MAYLDNLLTLVTDGDPGAISAWGTNNDNIKLIGSPLDVSQIDVYKIAGNDTHPIWAMPSDGPLFMNVFVKETVSSQSLNAYTFSLWSGDILNSGSLASKINVICMGSFDGALLNKGSTVSVPLTTGAKIGRWLQVGISSTLSVGNESGRFDIGMSLQSNFNVLYPRARGIGPMTDQMMA